MSVTIKLIKWSGLLFLILAQTGISQEIQQTQEDSYTRYELLAPSTQSFRIIYDVTATAAGAAYYFNTIRKGSKPKMNAVYDRKSGAELPWKIVDGPEAKASGHVRANPEGQYIRVKLARPVPEGGGTRIRIDKEYLDAASYFHSEDTITFSRTLGIKRNAIVLPTGYEIIVCNYPVQVVTEDDGRIRLSFMNRGPRGVPIKIVGRKLSNKNRNITSASAGSPATQMSNREISTSARVDFTFPERAYQNREIVYFLKQPETHSFFLYHDYTETRPGVDKYLNLVRAGSKASNPSAINLDTGEKLKVETLVGNEITEKGIEIRSNITPETEVVVIWFDPVQKGHSTRLRISETYTDANRYVLSGDELVWDRSFGRSQNVVILPESWYLTANAVPATINETEDGRVRLTYINDRPGNIEVFIKGKRR